MPPIADLALWELIKHIRQWLTNLRRAGSERREQSIDALRAVIVAARYSKAYMRALEDHGQSDHTEEAKLAETWTRLGFELDDLGLVKLAKRCDISGRYWSDPRQFEGDFLEQADIGLQRMEQLARQMVADIENP